MLAFDKRVIDADGRLHAVAPISKANVCPYLGAEINAVMENTRGWRRLADDRTYHLLRDPSELRKAAKTFNNLPVLSQHVPVSAQDHQPHLVVGSTGTSAQFVGPYLQNSLVVWSKHAIDAINSGSRKELSSAYRYTADMRPGWHEGQRYDGIMRNIVANHVALVSEGRAGRDVALDEKPRDTFRTFHRRFPAAARIRVV